MVLENLHPHQALGAVALSGTRMPRADSPYLQGETISTFGTRNPAYSSYPLLDVKFLEARDGALQISGRYRAARGMSGGESQLQLLGAGCCFRKHMARPDAPPLRGHQ
jgi:hypothetical protein